ncbi:hypothetical protein KC460_00140 [Candidatus Dependentiae bacterium]|nr:hypothetical protein [Candidatus Dependentiae bacterium]
MKKLLIILFCTITLPVSLVSAQINQLFKDVINLGQKVSDHRDISIDTCIEYVSSPVNSMYTTINSITTT